MVTMKDKSPADFSRMHMLVWIGMTQSCVMTSIAKTLLVKYIEKFYHQKLKIFQIKKSEIFHISAQNTDYGYPLDPPRWSTYSFTIMYTSLNPSFTI